MASWRYIKWDGNDALDKFPYRVTQLGKALGLNDQHILDTFKLGLPSNIYVNLAHIVGIKATLEYGQMTYGCVKRAFTRCKCHIKHSTYGNFRS